MNHWERIKQPNVLEQIKATNSTVITGTNAVINCLFSHKVVSTSREPYMNTKATQSPSSSGKGPRFVLRADPGTTPAVTVKFHTIMVNDRVTTMKQTRISYSSVPS